MVQSCCHVLFAPTTPPTAGRRTTVLNATPVPSLVHPVCLARTLICPWRRVYSVAWPRRAAWNRKWCPTGWCLMLGLLPLHRLPHWLYFFCWSSLASASSSLLTHYLRLLVEMTGACFSILRLGSQSEYVQGLFSQRTRKEGGNV